MTPRCSIVIRAYNEEKHIARLLDGIQQQTIREVQTVLVDSGSTDATVQIAQQYPVQIVRIAPEDFTFGRSLNMGIGTAKAEWVVIASAHVYPVYPDWLERLLAPFENPQTALSYGKQRGCSTTKFSEHQIFNHWFPEHTQLRQDHPFCNNANAAIRRSLWQQQAYNEALPALEDLAWARWAFEQGYGIAYVAEAEVVHVHNETWQGIYNRYRRESMAFKQIYPHEHFYLRDLVWLYLRNVLSDFKAARHQRVLYAEAGNILRFRWMQFWGTYQGYRQSGPLTRQLRQAFYYPRSDRKPIEKKSTRQVAPIQYTEAKTEPTADSNADSGNSI